MASELKAKDKLIWLGLTRAAQSLSEVKEEIEKLKEDVGGYESFTNDIEDLGDYSDLEDYLLDNGFSQSEADSFIQKVQNNFESFSDFQNYVNQQDSYESFQTGFGSESSLTTQVETEDGQPAGGVRVFENNGVTRDGVSAPAGSVEVFGTEVHFSSSAATKTGGSGGTGGGSEPVIEVRNLTTDDDDNVVNVFADVTFTAIVESNSDYAEFVVASLTEDGSTIESENFKLGPNGSRQVSFTVRKEEIGCHDYKINTAGPITVCWKPSGLIA